MEAIAAAYDENGKLRHIGNVGGGFSNSTLEDLRKKISRVVTKTATVEGSVDSPTPVTWIKPRLVVEVAYMTVTADGRLRFPRFKRLRPDKDPLECKLP